MKKEKLIVLFRKHKVDNDIEIGAYFPTISEDTTNPNIIRCYHHIGQHSVAHIDYVSEGKVCTIEEYTPLLAELQGIYDDVDLVVKKNMIHRYHNERLTAFYKRGK